MVRTACVILSLTATWGDPSGPPKMPGDTPGSPGTPATVTGLKSSEGRR